ncbi:hypothetical protein DFH09DRAFT_1180550 [Mycena vulgaris]|nr:hypothetical protein DFH09DRAFT_1180550 [Mycena vulgaris]
MADDRLNVSWPCTHVFKFCEREDNYLLKSVCIDVIQGHHRYYTLTGRTLYGGNLGILRPSLECHFQPGLRVRGVLVALDFPTITDPLLLTSSNPSKSKRSEYQTPTHRETVRIALTSRKSQARRYTKELISIFGVLLRNLLDADGRREVGARKLSSCSLEDFRSIATFQPPFSRMGETWIIPLFRRLLDQNSAHVGQTTYEHFVDVITQDMGPEALILNAALYVPLPLPTPVQLTPTFEYLTHIGRLEDLKNAVVDIANAVTQFSIADEIFASLTPDRMLFQKHTLSGRVAGYVLDLDPLEEPSNIAAHAGRHHDPRAVRLAAYDLISDPKSTTPRTLYPRHALESLFNVLLWFYLCNEFSDSGVGVVPRKYAFTGHWFHHAKTNLPPGRTGYVYQQFMAVRCAFFTEWPEGAKERRSAEMRALETWLMPLWSLIAGAHSGSPRRKRWDGGDCETLGGHFTVDKFMKILAPAPP